MAGRQPSAGNISGQRLNKFNGHFFSFPGEALGGSFFCFYIPLLVLSLQTSFLTSFKCLSSCR